MTPPRSTEFGRSPSGRRRIHQELVKHGATSEQATMYCNLVDYFVDLSKQECVTEKHHILPRQSGWWKKYQNAKWNIAVISWQLHGSLHAVLCHIFPTNKALWNAAWITSNTFRGNEKKLRIKAEIIRLYQKGKSCPHIGKRYGRCPDTIRNWLKEWNIPRRTLYKTLEHKPEIIHLYQGGKSAEQIGKKFGASIYTILRRLKYWGIPIHSGGIYYGNKKSKYRSEIIHLYQIGKSAGWIADKLGVSRSTIYAWLKEWGIQIRKRGYQSKPFTQAVAA